MRIMFLHVTIFFTAIFPFSPDTHAAESATTAFAEKPDHAVLFVIDGLSYKY